MFGDLFGQTGASRGRQQRRPQKGADVETTATIGFNDALNGVTISLRLTSDAPCPDCSGTGGKPGTRPHICPECEGAGFVTASVGGAFSMNETCPACGGRQLVYDDRPAELWAQMNHNRAYAVRWATTTLLSKPDTNHLGKAAAETTFWVAIDWATYRTLTRRAGLTDDECGAWLSTYYKQTLLTPQHDE